MEKKPCRQRERDLVVFPWAGVVTHIPGTCDPELAARQIEEYLSEFEPHNVSMVATTADKAWQTAVVQFKGDIFGYMNSVALDGFFQRIDRGRQGWASAPLRDEVKQTGGTPSEWCLYGWMATKDDLIVDDELGLHLSNRGRLSTIAGVVEEVVQRSVTKAEIRALKEVGELENQAELWNTGQELVLRKEAKDLEPLMNTLITKLDGVREVLSSSSGSSSDEEALCIATSVLQTHGPSPGISFKHSPQFSSFGLVSENFDGRFGDESTLQLDRCASIGTGGSVIQDYSKMLRLKRDWGDALFRKFMTVLAENEASSTKGWGGKAVAWNIAENRKATLAEVIKGLEQVIEAKDAAKGTGIKEQRRTVFESGKLQPTKVLQLMEEELGRGLRTGEVNKEDLKRKNRLLEMTKHELERKGALIAEVKDQLSENIEQIRTFKEELQKKSSLIEAQKEELQSKDQDLEALREELKRKDNLINAKDLLIEARRNAIEKKDYLNKTLSLELKLKNHLLEAKREEVRRKDVLIRARGLDSVFSGDVKEPLLIEDEPNGLSHVFTAMMDADTDAERRYPKRTRN